MDSLHVKPNAFVKAAQETSSRLLALDIVQLLEQGGVKKGDADLALIK